jgi:superfamily II DNA or RNA helicase
MDRIQPGSIIKNLIPQEPVVITKIQLLGNMVSIAYTGKTSNRANTKVISHSVYDRLEVLTEEGSYNFKGDPNKFTIYAEAERINSAYQFDPLFAVNCSIVDPLPHQVEAVYRYLLPLPKIRFLLADDTGAGKTIMTGLLIKELLMRGIVERILIVTPGGLTKQWQEDEMGVKFNMNFTLVNRSLFSSDPNIFHNADKIVTSIDFICQDDVLNVVNNSHWDLIVFDESHKLSAYDYGTKQYLSRRYQAAKVLSQQCEHLLLLTATPHRGRTDTFTKLLQLLDEDIFADEGLASDRIREIEHDDTNKFFIRRLKEDMRDWGGEPLYKNRYTKTVSYELTPEEKGLYDAVTKYLMKKKSEASDSRNIHVSLALTVMQRRLVSSIYAIRNTLKKRWSTLQSVLDELNKNPNLLNQRQKLEGFEKVENIDDYEELDDEERESLENILSDPRKFKLFTTAKSIPELHDETKEVKKLYDMAETLYVRNQEEQKFKELQELLKSEGVLEQGEKLVIFTEHKDTLDYLEERLAKNGGYHVVTIHGGKNVDERAKAQREFIKSETQILIATDAAGEGINLQFCRLLINWDIPWNPNRLEQRMGRIHRYGQKKDVLVFNMVASNTKEGQVLQRLLEKIDVIRNDIGNDRVYDVIQDVMENVGLEDLINSVLNGKETKFNEFLDQNNEDLKIQFNQKLRENKEKLAHSVVDYRDARKLKDSSDEKRLQPIYVRLFFEKAFKALGGEFTEIRTSIYRIDKFPDEITKELRVKYNTSTDSIRGIYFCFDKQVFLDYQNIADLGKVHYINPGNILFDSLINVVRTQYKEEMIKGTVLISPDDRESYFAFFVKSQIIDDRENKQDDSIADERLLMVVQESDGNFYITSPAKFIDLHPPLEFAKPIEPPEMINDDEVVSWSFDNITMGQLQDTRNHVEEDTARRREYLDTAFKKVIIDLQMQINELQSRLLLGDFRDQEKIAKKEERIRELKYKKEKRMKELDLMTQLSPKQPDIIGAAYIVPLTKVEYQNHYGMSRDDEVEAIAMKIALDYELSSNWSPEDVSANNEGYDIRSISPEGLKRYIEVKGRSLDDGSVMLSENEMNRLGQLGESAWLYIVINCKSTPEIFCIQNPAKNLNFDKRFKGVQYFLSMAEWKGKIQP